MKRDRKHNCRSVLSSLALLLIFIIGTVSKGDDGYRLWLRYDLLPKPVSDNYRPRITELVVPGSSDTAAAIRTELVSGCTGLLGRAISVASDVARDGAVLVGTPQSAPQIARLRLGQQLAHLGSEGYWIHSSKLNGHAVTVIASSTEVGALYGAFHFLRLLQTLQPIDRLDIRQTPRLQLRVLDHWDNLDGTIERGYAGRSLWDWQSLPGKVDPRLQDYARANASVGINGSTLNNVNANSQILSADYLRKVAAIAGVFRPYGIHV